MAPKGLDTNCRFNIAKGLVSIFILACGLFFVAIVQCLVHKLIINVINEEMYEYQLNYKERIAQYQRYDKHWAFGCAYIFTGITGLITSCVRKRAAYITHMVFAIVSLGINVAVGIYVFRIYQEGLVPEADDTYCVHHQCLCRGSVSAVMVKLLVVVVIGWVLTCVTVVVSGVLACKKEDTQDIDTPSAMNTTDVQLSPLGSFQTGYLRQDHDHAHLVSNMEYQPGVQGK